jgi:hypothetical protein
VAVLEVPAVVERVLGEGTFSVEKFVESFGVMVEAAGGTKRLRGLILEMATRGILLPQRSSHGLTSEGPHSIPLTWKWTTFDEVTMLITDGEHLTPQRVNTGQPLVTAKNVREGFLDLASTDFVSKETAEKCWKRCRPNQGDVLMVCVGATTGRVCVLREDLPGVLVRSVALLRPSAAVVDADYLATVLRSPFGQSQIWGNVKEQAQPCLYLGRMKALPFPLPPVAEQKRIVARVDQLMALIDQLEAKQNRKRDLGAHFTQASLEALTTAENPQDFTTAWTRILENWPTLLDHPDKVRDVQKVVLELAVRGMLTEALANEPPAAVTEESEGGAFPFPIRQSWRWVRLDALCERITKGSSPKWQGVS